jgi:hypothetical protein
MSEVTNAAMATTRTIVPTMRQSLKENAVNSRAQCMMWSVERTDLPRQPGRLPSSYVGHEFNDAGEFCTGMVELQLSPLVKPAPPTNVDQVVEFELWKRAWHTYEKQLKARHRNSARVYALVIGQCSQALCNCMEANNQWSMINKASNVIGVLQLIQNCMTQCQTWQKPVHSLMDVEAQVYAFQ